MSSTGRERVVCVLCDNTSSFLTAPDDWLEELSDTSIQLGREDLHQAVEGGLP